MLYNRTQPISYIHIKPLQKFGGFLFLIYNKFVGENPCWWTAQELNEQNNPLSFGLGVYFLGLKNTLINLPTARSPFCAIVFGDVPICRDILAPFSILTFEYVNKN